jgi:hypothetical protein
VVGGIGADPIALLNGVVTSDVLWCFESFVKRCIKRS